MSSWYETGFSSIAKEEERLAAAQLPNSFWITVGASKSVIFVDDEPTTLQEHMIKLANEKFFRPLTCIKKVYPEEPSCCIELGQRDSYLVGYNTIIDCSEKKDPKYSYELQLFAGKLGTLKRLQIKKNAKGSLVNMKWTISRTGEKSPRCGDDFEYIQDVKSMDELYKQVTYRGTKIKDIFDKANKAGPDAIAKVRKIFQISLDDKGKILPSIPAFNYEELLKPLDPLAIRVMMRSRVKTEGGFGAAAGMPGSVEETPF